MKRILALFLAIISVAGLCACGVPKETNSVLPTETSQTQIATTESEPVIETEPEAKPVLSPESAVQIILNAVDNWILEDKSYMAGYRYLLLDLDFDGILELVTNACDGSMRISTNTYYKINLNNYTLEAIDIISDSGDGTSQLDYNLINYPKLLEDKTTGEKHYVLANMTKDGDMYSLSEYKLIYSENAINKEKLFYKYAAFDYVEGEPAYPEKFKVVYSGDSKEVTEEDYENEYSDYYLNFTDLNINHKTIDGSAFSSASYSERKNILLDCYESFSYDGFDFGSIETYDIDIEPNTTAAPTTEALPDATAEKIYDLISYEGLTINDVADMWGYDYVLEDGLYKGGWKGVYYSDGRIPFRIYFNATPENQTCTGTETIAGIILSAEDAEEFCIADGISANLTVSELESLMPDGNKYSLLIDDTNNFSFSTNEVSVIYTWNDNYESIADYITVDFSFLT